MSIMKKLITFKNALLIVCFLTFSCDYLDVVPDNIPTIDYAFRNRTEAQSYLYGLLGGMPDVGNYAADPALAGSDEIWLPDYTGVGVIHLRRILLGEQIPSNPLANYWASKQQSNISSILNGGKALWTTISDCNIFLENIHLPFDLLEDERNRWKGEALFIKAYLHFWLFRQYGPIPLIKENFPIDTKTEEIMRFREPVDEVADYIVELLDQAIDLLPIWMEVDMLEQGRPTKSIAAALKAQVLALAASPLFNCNPDYAGYKDKRGIQLFPQDESAKQAKWKRAADAVKEAIDRSNEALHRLYNARTDLPNSGYLSDSTIFAFQVRGAVTERWNDEIIWGNSRTNNHANLQRLSFPQFNIINNGGGGGLKNWAPTLGMVEQFYSKNGLPIEDDADWVAKLEYKRQTGVWARRTATAAERQYIRQGRETIELHFDREPRFYGSICFDQGTYFGNNPSPLLDNSTNANALFVTEFKKDLLNGHITPDRSSYTGYLCKKIVNVRSASPLTANSYTNYAYAFPIIRLADLYLLYAEALNEWKDVPDNEVYEYIDLVRNRSGLKGVVESWNGHAVAEKKNLPASKEGMRNIIRRERLNELAFEGVRYWDLRRWKLAEDYLNRPIRGLNIYENTADGFYREVELFSPVFEKKDYFTPIRTGVLVSNTNLLQSPYWQITEDY